MTHILSRKRLNQSGQAILEYVLVLAIVFSLMSMIMVGVRNTRDKTWKRMLCDVATMCADCKPPSSVDGILPKAGKCK